MMVKDWGWRVQWHWALGLLGGLVWLTLLGGVAGAVTTNWIGTTGDWNTAGNWDNGVPASGDNAYVDNNGTAQITGGTASSTYLFLGYNQTGTVAQTGGTFSLGMDVRLGDNSGSSGRYDLSGGTLSAYQEYVGLYGNGEFNHTGGSNSITEVFVVAHWAGSQGAYNLSGDSTLTAKFEYIGYSGQGAFTQSGGSHTVGTISPGSDGLYLGYTQSGNGTYNLNSGSLLIQGPAYIGYQGTSTFNQEGGTNNISQNLILGYYNGSLGTYNLSGGTLHCADQEIIGYDGSGTFIQTGGSNTVVRTLAIALDPPSTGVYHFLGGELNAGAITVYPTGTFRGAGTLTAGTFTNHGLVQPGASVGTLNIQGNFVQTSYGKLEIEIASPTGFDRLNISGTAQLAGTLTPVLVGGYTPTGTVSFPFLTAAGGVSGTFEVLNSPTVKFTLEYYPTWVELLFTRTYTDPSLGLTPNQWQVGNMLNQVAGGATGDLARVLNAIDDLPTAAAVRGAFQDISPDKAAALPQVGLETALLLQRSLAQRLTDLRFGGKELNAAGGFHNPLSRFGSRSQGIMLAFNGASLAGLLPAREGAGAAFNRWGVFLDPQVIIGHQGSTANQTGYDYTLAGFNLGVDCRLRRDFLLGLATGYSHTGASFKGTGGSLSNHTWPSTAYAAYLPERGYAFLSLGYSLNLFDLERRIAFGGLSRKAKSATTGHQFNLYAEAGYDLKLKPLVVTPAVSLAYSHIGVEGFKETGAGALNLKVAAQNADSLQTGVGAKVALPLKAGAAKVVPQAYAFYQHEFANHSRGLDSRLSQGGSTMLFTTGRPQRDFAVVGGSLAVFAGQKLSAAVNYNASVGRSKTTDHLVNVGLRWEF